jgi:xanthine dehydrogenase accessory factor
MRELQDIIQKFEQVKKNNRRAALATVVKTSGSVYRRPGARLLVMSGGETVGMISGGCLERDVRYHIDHSLSSDQPIVITYDTTTDEDLYLGLGLGCHGIVQILIEPLSARSNALDFLADCLHRCQRGVLATVFFVKNVAAVKVGDRLTFDEAQTLSSHIEHPQLTRAIAQDAQLAFSRQQSIIQQYQLPDGTVEVLLEFVQPSPKLTIFGAEPDAIPVARLARELGWQITVVDTRQSETTAARFSMVEQTIQTCPEKARDLVQLDSNAIAVVMTHNYLHDLELLKWLLPCTLLYLGILGPRRRTDRLLKELEFEGIMTTVEQRERLYSPIGLDIGAETPEAIALSILAEIQAVLTHRPGKFLREGNAPIHQALISAVQILSS